jgi:hypothetical protein
MFGQASYITFPRRVRVSTLLKYMTVWRKVRAITLLRYSLQENLRTVSEHTPITGKQRTTIRVIIHAPEVSTQCLEFGRLRVITSLKNTVLRESFRHSRVMTLHAVFRRP